MPPAADPMADGSAPSHASRQRFPLWAGLGVFALLAGLLTLLGVNLVRSQQGPVVVGQAAPPFSLTAFDGSVHNLAYLQGKVVVLNFWASWCQPCEEEAALLEEVWRAYQPGGKVAFLGADYVDTEAEARAYLQKFEVTYPNGPDLQTRISQAYRILGVPETYIIDPQGVIVHRQIGPFASAEQLVLIIDPLVP